MNKEQKEKLKNALQEANAPEKDKLLDRIEQRKNFAESFQAESEYVKKKKRKSTTIAVAFALSFVLCVVVIVSIFSWIAKAFSDELYIAGGGTIVDGERYEDNSNRWNLTYDGYISFEDADISYDEFCRLNAIDRLIPLLEGWSVTRTQLTQDESAYREYRTNGKEQIEVTVFTEGKIPALDTRYKYFLEGEGKVYTDGRVWYTSNLILNGTDFEYAYVFYGEDAIYCVYSTMELYNA